MKASGSLVLFTFYCDCFTLKKAGFIVCFWDGEGLNKFYWGGELVLELLARRTENSRGNYLLCSFGSVYSGGITGPYLFLKVIWLFQTNDLQIQFEIIVRDNGLG